MKHSRILLQFITSASFQFGADAVHAQNHEPRFIALAGSAAGEQMTLWMEDSTHTLEPGDIIAVDYAHPGAVRLTDKPCDRSVLGVISEANANQTPSSLIQVETPDGDHSLAFAGNVHVKVVGKVEVGDWLTTSTTKGRAMAVPKYRKAIGSLIGKALESDSDGDGFVLMLVQPR